MIESPQDSRDKSGTAPPAGEELPYRIELWQAGEAARSERVLARAFSATLGQAIYKAAQTEHPDRRITLSQGDRLIADSAADRRRDEARGQG